MVRVYENLGFQVLPRVLEDIGLEKNSKYGPNEDKTQNKWMFPQLAEELEPLPEAGDHYIGA